MDGEVSQHVEYFPFGETFLEEHSNTDRTPYLFNGKELDEETGLYYYGARYYDAKASVWQSVDAPLISGYYLDFNHNGGVLNSFNLGAYIYCRNNPVIYTDPDGNQYHFSYTLDSNGYAQFSNFTVGDPLDFSTSYTLNGRSTTSETINKINGRSQNDPIVQKGIDKLRADNAANGGNFSDDYYAEFGSFLINNSIPSISDIRANKNSTGAIRKGVSNVTNFLDNTSGFGGGKGSPLYHLYENMVRKNNNTGFDKLLHFSFTAKYATYGIGLFMGEMKEFFKDEVPSWFGNDKGWDNLDIKANERGNSYMLNIINQVGVDDTSALHNSSLFNIDKSRNKGRKQ